MNTPHIKAFGDKMSMIRIVGSPMINIDDGGFGGIPVLFVHSLAGNIGHWSSQLDHIRKERRAIAIDLRGHGLSETSKNGDYAVESLAKDIDAVVNALDLQRFVLVGHSMGGSASIAYAGLFPKKVAGLLLADPSGDARKIPKEQIAPFMDALQSESYPQAIESYWREMLVGSRNDVSEKVLSDLHNTCQETILGVFDSTLKFDPLTALRHYNGPKLSIITHLNETPFSLHNILCDLPFIKVSGTGHWLQMDKPDEFNRILDEFLASVDKCGGELREVVQE
jgi:pimeloyl-ACP methyl ester carboxylesterase